VATQSAKTTQIPVALPNGTTILVESTTIVEEVGVEGLPSLKRVGEAIEGVAAELVDSIRKAKPDKASVELGFEIAGNAGIPVLAQGSAKANVTVTLEWDTAG
jgi:hypothetical protein